MNDTQIKYKMLLEFWLKKLDLNLKFNQNDNITEITIKYT